MADFFLRLAGNTLAELPKAPSNVQTSDIANRELVLTWTNNSLIGDNNVVQQWNPQTLKWFTVATIGLSENYYNVHDLLPNTSYRLRIAVILDNNYFPSLTTEFTTTNLNEPIPFNIAASGDTMTTAVITWENEVVEYMGEWNRVQIKQAGTVIQSANVALSATTYYATGLTMGVSYTAEVCTRDIVDGHEFFYCGGVYPTFNTYNITPTDIVLVNTTISSFEFSWTSHMLGNEPETLHQYILCTRDWSTFNYTEVALSATTGTVSGLTEIHDDWDIVLGIYTQEFNPSSPFENYLSFSGALRPMPSNDVVENILPTSGLIHKFEFNGSSIDDISGSLGSDNNIDYVQGFRNGAISSLDGNEAYVDMYPLGFEFAGNNPFTVTGWKKPGDGGGWICQLITDNSGSCGILMDNYNGNFRYYDRVGSEHQFGNSPNDEFQFMAITYDGSETKVYANTYLIHTQSESDALANLGNLYLGRSNNYHRYDQVYIYNRALTYNEVMQVRNGGLGHAETEPQYAVIDLAATRTYSGLTATWLNNNPTGNTYNKYFVYSAYSLNYIQLDYSATTITITGLSASTLYTYGVFFAVDADVQHAVKWSYSTITTHPLPFVAPTGATRFWAFEESAVDAVVGAVNTYEVEATYESGHIGFASNSSGNWNMSTPYVITGNTPFTLNVWANNANQPFTILKAEDANNAYALMYKIVVDSTENLTYFDRSLTENQYSITDYQDWNMYTITYDGTDTKIWFNGSNVGTVTEGTALTQTSISLAGVVLDGGYIMVDQARFYDRALSGAEILSLLGEY